MNTIANKIINSITQPSMKNEKTILEKNKLDEDLFHSHVNHFLSKNAPFLSNETIILIKEYNTKYEYNKKVLFEMADDYNANDLSLNELNIDGILDIIGSLRRTSTNSSRRPIKKRKSTSRNN